MRLPENPLVHEIFTWVWLADLSARTGRPVTLADVPTRRGTTSPAPASTPSG